MARHRFGTFVVASGLLFGCSGGDGGGGNSGGAQGGSAQGGSAQGGSAGQGRGGAGAQGGTASGGSGGQGASGGSAGSGGAPAAVCEAPELRDVSNPTNVVGDGTAASCTAQALQDAAAAGGIITFACGDDPITIDIASVITLTEETVIDGEGLVTLSGGGSSRILYLDSGYDTPEPRLTVQRLRFTRGQAPAGGEDTAQGGGAIYRDGGSLTVIDSVFDDNHAPAPGQDIAGGAIYGFGGGDTIVSGSSFTNNSASNGGAIGSLNGDLTILNSTFTNNAALGTDGNPGNGGCGGALYMDGRDEVTTLCGITITDNTAGAIGGGVFRVSNTDDGTFSMERSSVDNNEVTPSDKGNAGGLYLQGLAISISASTISRNSAYYNGGIWLNESQVDLVNSTIAGNATKGSNGGAIWLGNGPTGSIVNCTIADNHAVGDDTVCGGIFGDGLTLRNTIVADNTARYTNPCNQTREGGSGNLQWPDGKLCSSDAVLEDPKLGALGPAMGSDLEVMVPAGDSAARGIGVSCPETDQLGNPRPSPCTAGAVEAP